MGRKKIVWAVLFGLGFGFVLSAVGPAPSLADGDKDKNKKEPIGYPLYYDDVLWTLAFSPDGKLLASGAGDGSVLVWEAATGRGMRLLGRHAGDVRSVAFSLNGQLLASASYDGTVRLWEMTTGRLDRVLEGHSDFVRAVAFSPDGKLVASGSKDKTIVLWDVETGEKLRTLKGHTDWINSLAFSPDGTLLASGSLDRGDHDTVKLWDVVTGRNLRTLQGHTKHVWAVAFHPDGRQLASASSDGTVRLWDVWTGKEVATWVGSGGFQKALAFSPDGRRLASGSSKGEVTLWDPRSAQALLRLSVDGEVHSLSFSPDGRYLAAAYCARRNVHGCFRGAVMLWDIPDLLGQSEGPLLRRFDFNGNGRLEDEEFFVLIGAWIAGEISDPAFFAAIDLWVSGGRRVSPQDGGIRNELAVLVFHNPGGYVFQVEGGAAPFRVDIYDLAGRRIFTGKTAGTQLPWRLRTREGRPVADGVYIYVITQPSRQVVGKLVVLSAPAGKSTRMPLRSR